MEPAVVGVSIIQFAPTRVVLMVCSDDVPGAADLCRLLLPLQIPRGRCRPPQATLQHAVLLHCSCHPPLSLHLPYIAMVVKIQNKLLDI